MIKAEVNKNHIEAECNGGKIDILTELVMLCSDVINEIADNETDKICCTSTFCTTLKFALKVNM